MRSIVDCYHYITEISTAMMIDPFPVLLVSIKIFMQFHARFDKTLINQAILHSMNFLALHRLSWYAYCNAIDPRPQSDTPLSPALSEPWLD